jgi:hypothetical protein
MTIRQVGRRGVTSVVLAFGFAVIALCGGGGCAPGAADFVVAPDGDDANPGTAAAPLATLERARDAVRALRAQAPRRDVCVLLRGGTYRIGRTVVFSMEDSVAAGYSTTYAAWPGETPVLSSGVPITGWERVEKAPGLPPKSRGKVWSAAVPAEAGDVAVLFDGDRRVPRARGAGLVPLMVKSVKEGKSKRPLKGCYEMVYPEGAVRGRPEGFRWDLVVVPRRPWVMNILPITELDTAARMIRTDVPATYPLQPVSFGHFPEGTAWIENAIQVLDQPGEWAFDSESRRLYLWPEGERPSAGIVAPALTELIRVEGAIDYEGPVDQAVRGIVFRGLTFTHGDRFRWRTDKTGWGLQHDWEMFDQPTALVRLRGAEECVVEGCRFVNTGGAGVRLDLHAQRNVVRGNLIARVGGVGVLLAGYGPGTKDVNRENVVEGNHIHDVGELLWHSAGVFAWQSGENRIQGNLLHDCPYTAIVVSGRIGWDRTGKRECSRTVRWAEVDAVLPNDGKRPSWKEREPFLHGRRNVVEGNEILDVMKTMGDGNAIYVSGTGDGNVVRGNFIHDSPGPNMNAAIRCDDDQHGTIITHNIVFRTCGEGIIFKGNNTVTNNIFAEIVGGRGKGVKRPRGYIVMPYGDVSGSVVAHNILYSTDGKTPPWSECKGNKRRGPSLVRDCRADRNLYFCTVNPTWAKAMLEEQCGYGVECHSVEADPKFVAIDLGDFRLLPDSPARALGIESLTPAVIDRSVFPFDVE